MPNRPPLHRQYRARERKQWDKGHDKQHRLTGRALQQRNARIKIRDQFTCQNKQCCLVTTELEVDHRLAVAAGGTDDDSNCRSLCHQCHSIKSRIEGKGKRLPNPDSFPLVYEQARRLVEWSDGVVVIDDEHDDVVCGATQKFCGLPCGGD
jgi:5-methylcytosine-specific restriction enzyme A